MLSSSPPTLRTTHSTPPFSRCIKVHGYDPVTREATLQSVGTNNKLLMRRYALVQKARDADVFGILVGTLGVGAPPTFLLYLSLSL